ncbi:unnamed protein product [Coffea canephora]|uniref:Uncharacterized protein n=1 Tax=Coffea canephora TaxID=49390 RepID=A0A068V708_COFCA|nr:unnamed protein product [Coffea canephora]
MEFQTTSGQMIDLIITLEEEKDLCKYSLSLHRLTYCQFFLFLGFWGTIVACALLMSSENLKNHIDVKNILIDMVIYFQVQVNSCLIDAILCSKNFMSDAVLVKHVLTNFF